MCSSTLRHSIITQNVPLGGGEAKDMADMDGMNMWDALSENSGSPRELFLHNIDESRGIQGIRYQDWKLVKGKCASSHCLGLVTP